jgi:hypothetical protein
MIKITSWQAPSKSHVSRKGLDVAQAAGWLERGTNPLFQGRNVIRKVCDLCPTECQVGHVRMRLEQQEGKRVRLLTRRGYDWSDRYPLIVQAALRLRKSSFVIDGEAVVLGPHGISDFGAMYSGKRVQPHLVIAVRAASLRFSNSLSIHS